MSKSKKTIKKETIKKKSDAIENTDDEPGLKEYAIIIGIIFLLVGGIYYFFEIFYPTNPDDYLIDKSYRDAGITDLGFKYKYQPYEGKTVNIDFVYDLSSLEQFTFSQELTKEWLLSYDNLTILTPDVLENRSENGLLIKSSVKFSSFLRHAIGVSLGPSNFKQIGQGISCDNATEDFGIITFNYTAQSQGVVIDKENPNCILINAQEDSVDFVQNIDKIMYDLVIIGN